MTKTAQLPTDPTPPNPQTRPWVAYTVENFETADGQPGSSWTRIGVAFAHKDGDGFNLILKALPLDGRLVLRAPSDTEPQK